MRFWYWVSCALVASLLGALVLLGRKDALIHEQRTTIEAQTRAIVALCVHVSRTRGSPELDEACLGFLEEYGP